MSKNHQRSNREMKKPKQMKVAVPAAGASPFAAPSGAKAGQPTRTPRGRKIPGYLR